MRIILDTNFLLIPGEFGVDVFSELQRICDFNYDLYIVDQTVDEIEQIIDKDRGLSKRAAKLALDLAKKFDIGIIKTGRKNHVDDLLVDMAGQGNTIIATQDKELRDRINKIKGKIIMLRQKKYLILLG